MEEHRHKLKSAIGMASAVVYGASENRLLLQGQVTNAIFSVSLAYIRTPLSAAHSSTRKEEPFAAEAKEFLRLRYVGETVSYAFVWKHYAVVQCENENVGLQLVRFGLATVESRTHPPSEYLAAQQLARKQGIGLHSTCRPEEHVFATLPLLVGDDFALLGDHLVGCHVKLWIESVHSCCTFDAILSTSGQAVVVQLCGVQPATDHPDAGRLLAGRILLHRLVPATVEECDVESGVLFVNLLSDTFTLLPFLLQGLCSVDRTTLHLVRNGDDLRLAQEGAAANHVGMWKERQPQQDSYRGVVVGVPKQNTVEVLLIDSATRKLTHSHRVVKLAFMAESGPLDLLLEEPSVPSHSSLRCSLGAFAAREELRKCCIGQTVIVNEISAGENKQNYAQVRIDHCSDEECEVPKDVACCLLAAGMSLPVPVPTGTRSFCIPPPDSYWPASNMDAHRRFRCRSNTLLEFALLCSPEGIADATQHLPFHTALPAVVEKCASISTFLVRLLDFGVIVPVQLAGIITLDTVDVQGLPKETRDLHFSMCSFVRMFAAHRNVTVQILASSRNWLIGSVCSEFGDLSTALLQSGGAIVSGLLRDIAESAIDPLIESQIAAEEAHRNLWSEEGKELLEILQKRRTSQTGIQPVEFISKARQKVKFLQISENMNSFWYKLCDDPATETAEHTLRELIRWSVTRRYWDKHLPRVGDFVVVRFAAREWVRAKVREVVGEKKLRVEFPDHGGAAVVWTEHIFQFPENVAATVKSVEPLAHFARHAFVNVASAALGKTQLTELRVAFLHSNECCIEQEFVRDNALHISLFTNADAPHPASYALLSCLSLELAEVDCGAADHSWLLLSKIRTLLSVERPE